MAGKKIIVSSLNSQEKFTIFYHSLFDFPLNRKEVVRWKFGDKERINSRKLPKVDFKDGFYFLKGREDSIKKRLTRKEQSALKMKVAKRSARVLSFFPTIKMVGITGSLAMNNADLNSDIDFMIVVKRGFLWITRFVSILVLILTGFKVRRYGDKDTKDKLCLNMWFDESDLVWQDHNLFSAHEIAQIVPLFSRDEIYEKFLFCNRWILNFWPNSVSIKKNVFRKGRYSLVDRLVTSVFVLFEILAYFIQRFYMSGKITREVVNYRRAIFHPVNLNPLISRKLKEVLASAG